MTAILLMQVAAKATVVLLAGWGVTSAMARFSAAARHLVWVLALAAAFVVPALHLAGPEWTLAVLPRVTTSTARTSAVSVEQQGLPTTVRGLAATSSSVAPVTSVASLAATEARPVAPPPAASAVPWDIWVVRVWLAGVALMLLRLGLGIVWAVATVRSAAELPDTDWLDALDDVAASLGLTRAVALKVSARAAVPMATGLWKAAVLLPPSAIEWSEQRRRVVLQHELAHVRRRDCLLQAFAQCVAALHWFNPAAHLAVARLRGEQERACDDLVIAGGTDARTYADHLLEIASSFRAASFPSWATMSMARPSQLEGRMLSILDGARDRCTPSPSLRTVLGGGAMAIAVSVGVVHLAAESATPSPVARVAVGPSAVADRTEVPMDASFTGVIGDGEVTSANREPVVSTVDVVHASVADVDLLAPLPALRLDDGIIRATVGDDRLQQLLINVSRGPRVLMAQTAAPAQSAVSDETRKRVADALISALNDDNSQVRQEALSALASMRDERAVPGLVRALADPVTDVRMRAVSALAQFTSAAAADGILSALKDRSADVREQATRLIPSVVGRGQLRDPKYVDALVGLLKDAAKDVRERAANALGDLADPRAIDPLTVALKDSEASVREQAARALGQIARGQRRGVRPATPIPPVPPVPPRAFGIDGERIREMAERARDRADRVQRDMQRELRDLDSRFERFVLPVPFPEPAPEPAPAPRR